MRSALLALALVALASSAGGFREPAGRSAFIAAFGAVGWVARDEVLVEQTRAPKHLPPGRYALGRPRAVELRFGGDVMLRFAHDERG